MATVIKTKNGSGAPLASDLVQGELAIDLTNKRLYTENASGTVIELGTVPSTIDINAGTIDGTVIGGSSAAAGSFTTLTASGEITANGGIALGDNDKATFGAGDDLQIYHDGSHSFISDVGVGRLYLQGTDGVRITNASAANMISAVSGDGVYSYYNGGLRLATTATGIDVTGTVTADGLDVSTLSGDATIYLQNQGSARGMKITKNYDDFSAKFFYSNHPTASAGTLDFKGAQNATQLTINGNGDISFYEDTGTTAKFFWDASAESLGIGTSSPARTLHVNNVIRLEPRAAAPSSPSAGDIFFNSTTSKLQCYDGTAWQDCF
jgi:hypothetical protein